MVNFGQSSCYSVNQEIVVELGKLGLLLLMFLVGVEIKASLNGRGRTATALWDID